MNKPVARERISLMTSFRTTRAPSKMGTTAIGHHLQYPQSPDSLILPLGVLPSQV